MYRLLRLTAVFSLGTALSLVGQQGSELPDAPPPGSPPPPAASTQQPNPPANDDQQDSSQKPGAMKRIKGHLHDQMSSGCVNAVIKQGCWGKSDKEGEQGEGQGTEQGGSDQAQAPKQTQPPLPPGQTVPRSTPPASPNESSSKDSEGDLGPLPDRYSGMDTGEVKEMQKWDPHRASKDIEVGDYYYKEKNYHAAESRYREALEWKPNDALASFRLAQALEKLGKNEEARKNYEAYLKILPSGELAPKAKEALKRLPASTVDASELNRPSPSPALTPTSPRAGTPR